jgi:hypothetical protein
MNPIARFMKKLSILFGSERFVSELDEEMAFHRAQVEKEFVANGMTPEAARYAAMRRFGNATKLREQSHEAVAFQLETVVQDLRFGLRQWTRNPGFALAAVLIGAGHRSERGHFRLRGCGSAGAASVCKSRPADVGERKQRRFTTLAPFLSGLS